MDYGNIITKEEAQILRAAMSIADELQHRFNNVDFPEEDYISPRFNERGFVRVAERMLSASYAIRRAIDSADIHGEQEAFKGATGNDPETVRGES